MIYAAKAALYIRKSSIGTIWRIWGFCKVRVYLFGKKGFWGIFHICQTCWKNGDMGHMERGGICFMEISKYIHETCWKKMDMGHMKRILQV